jgi:hypothetical protein
MRYAILKLMLVLAMMPIAGCVANQPKKKDVCPPNSTLVCETRMGQSEECTCRNKAEMREVFDLSRTR